MAPDVRFYRPGARDLGPCKERDCAGRMMLVEDMGDFLEAQCATCLTREGVGKVPAASSAGTARVGRTGHEDDAFLGAM
jgi:hypothetical protein